MSSNNKIQVGDTIGLITPSSPLFPGRLEASIKYFEEKGYKVKVGKHNKKADRFLAGTDLERAEDIMTFFADEDVKALIVTGGGAGSIRTLPYLDYRIIKDNPKPIIGFSDTTSLQLGIYHKTGNLSYTGFTCRDVAEKEELDPVIESSLDHCVQRTNYSITQGETVNPGLVTAPLLGGNLACLVNLLGTPYAPSFKECIFLFEEVWLEPYVIDGLLSQLWLAGVFDQVAGVVIGNFTRCDSRVYPKRDGTIDDLINDWISKIKVPTIRQFPYGHTDSRNVLPLGQTATLDATNCKLDIIFND